MKNSVSIIIITTRAEVLYTGHKQYRNHASARTQAIHNRYRTQAIHNTGSYLHTPQKQVINNISTHALQSQSNTSTRAQIANNTATRTRVMNNSSSSFPIPISVSYDTGNNTATRTRVIDNSSSSFPTPISVSNDTGNAELPLCHRTPQRGFCLLVRHTELQHFTDVAIGHLPRSRDLDLGEARRAKLCCLQFTRQLFRHAGR